MRPLKMGIEDDCIFTFAQKANSSSTTSSKVVYKIKVHMHINLYKEYL